MPTVDEHQRAVQALLEPLSSREPELLRWAEAPTGSLRDRVLARDILNPIDLPLFDNSQMDGYAVRAADVAPGAKLPVAPRVAAGHAAPPIVAGTAVPIMTGAPMPVGADAVIPIEDATPDRFLPEGDGEVVAFSAPVATGAFVRPRASDLAAGQLLLAAGTRLGPAQWGVIAASGIAEVELVPRTRVLVLSTGDELVRVGEQPGPGQVFDANGTSLALALAESGAVVEAVVVAPDDAARLHELIDGYDVDLIVSTGGASKGAYEVVRDVFEELGVEFVSVAMQPGGPQGLGVARLANAAVPMVAFPGNPVSALVSFEVFLRPVLRAVHGLVAERWAASLPLAQALDSPPAKHQVRRGRLNRAGEVELVGGPSSHLVHSYAASTLLVHVPVGVSHLDAGATVEVWRIDD
ncbi:MAG TPA: gephyrin-like molybdotransferase Glp [Galbitalea sp.]|jgi:molybdopterin molybdotransferase